MSEEKTGGSAFPWSRATPKGPVPYDDDHGMTLRDWFAGMAMASLYAGGRRGWEDERLSDHDWSEVVALNAYEMADAMIKERRR